MRRRSAICPIIIFVILGGFAFALWRHAQLARLSNIDHGDTLAEVMEGIRAEDFEVTAAFTAQGKKLFEYTNFEDASVAISDAHARLLRQYRGVIFLHNHPVWDKASFSSLDLEKLAGYKAGCGVIVSKNDTYVLLANGEWPSSAEIGQFVRDRPEMTRTIWFESSSGEMKAMSAVTYRLMELAAAEYNLSYYEWAKDEIPTAEIAAAVLK